MDVAITDLRANLKDWLALARDGQEVVVTDRGTPVARLLGVDAAATLERLTDEGVIARPRASQRPAAVGRHRPRPKRSVAAVVSAQRR